MQHKKSQTQASLNSFQTSSSIQSHHHHLKSQSISSSQQNQQNLQQKSKSRGRSRLNTQQSISYVNEVIQLQNYLRVQSASKERKVDHGSDKNGRDKQRSLSQEKKQTYKQQQEERSKSKDNNKYLNKIQNTNTGQTKQAFTNLRSNNPVRVNPQLLKPVLQTAHLPPQLHFKKSSRNNMQNQSQNQQDSISVNKSMRQDHSKSQTNTARNQPIKSLRKSTNRKDQANLKIKNGQHTLHNVSILSQNMTSSCSYAHSHKQSWQLNAHNHLNIPFNQQTTQDAVLKSQTEGSTDKFQNQQIKIENTNIPLTPLNCNNQLQNVGNTTSKGGNLNHHYQRFLNEDMNINNGSGCCNANTSCGKSPLDFVQNQDNYMLIDLQQSNEKSNFQYNSRQQRSISQGNVQGFSYSEANQNKCNHSRIFNDHNTIDANFKTLDFRTLDDLKSQQRDRRSKRRQLCLSLSSEFMQNLVLKVKSAMSKSVNRENHYKSVTQSQTINKENNRVLEQQAYIQYETRIKSRDLLKRNSENRLEVLKSEMKKSLVEYKRSKERLISQQKQITPIKDHSELRKVSAFAQSVLSFSHKIDKLISVQKSTSSGIKVPFQEQNRNSYQSNHSLSNTGNSQYNSKTSCNKQGYQTKLERENLESYKQSAQKQYAKLKENTNKHQRGFSQGKLIQNARALEQKTRNVMPSYIKRTYIEMSSSSSSDTSKNSLNQEEINFKDNQEQQQIENQSLEIDLPLSQI